MARDVSSGTASLAICPLPLDLRPTGAEDGALDVPLLGILTFAPRLPPRAAAVEELVLSPTDLRPTAAELWSVLRRTLWLRFLEACVLGLLTCRRAPGGLPGA